GLIAAVRWYARTCETRSGLLVEVTVGGIADDERLAPEVETAVFRIVQEGLTNVLKHAGAQHAWVDLHRDRTGLSVDAADDGVGLAAFDLAAADRSRRLGLFGIVERARLLGGDMQIGPRAAGGTLLRLRVPLAPPARFASVA